MKKVLMVVALLLLATPVFAADVNVTATWGTPVVGPNTLVPLTVGWTGAAEANSIRAFALVLTANNGCNLDNIRGFKRGESNSVSKGYGIFPGKFRQFIDVANPNYADWHDTNYNPLAPAGDLNSRGGNDSNTMVVELGTLYAAETGAPGTSGTLFVVDVNLEGQTSVNVCFAVEQTRGGVVKKDGTAASVILPGTGGCVTYTSCTTILNEVGQPVATAVAAWTGQGFTTSGSGVYSDTIAVNTVISHSTGCVTLPYTVTYVYSLGKFPTPSQIIYPKWDSDALLPIYWSQVAGATQYQLERSADSGANYTATVYTGTATFAANAVTPGTTYRYRVKAKNADSNSLYLAGTYDCTAYISTCYRNGVTTDPNWAQWVAAGRPDCWCKASTAQEPNGSGYQCDGDADGATGGASYRVYTIDQGMVVANWKKKNADITNDPNVTLAGKLKIHGACADIDHKTGGASYRVYTIDQGTIVSNWKKKSSSTATGTTYLPGNCPR